MKSEIVNLEPSGKIRSSFWKTHILGWPGFKILGNRFREILDLESSIVVECVQVLSDQWKHIQVVSTNFQVVVSKLFA